VVGDMEESREARNTAYRAKEREEANHNHKGM
jgi:hypothetical protein